MRRLHALLLCALITATLPAFVATKAGAEDRALTVVELFTSQGCAACPSADALIAELIAERNDVLALSFNVDYWDYIGWKDPFASPVHTARQKTYAVKMGLRHIYTPQVVVNGRLEGTGARRDVLLALIDAARLSDPLPVRIGVEDRTLTVHVGAAGAGFPPALALAEVMVLSFDRTHTTRVLGGENNGRTLDNHNVVRDIHPLGVWRGEAVVFHVPAGVLSGEAVAAIVQLPHQGSILGAAVHPHP